MAKLAGVGHSGRASVVLWAQKGQGARARRDTPSGALCRARRAVQWELAMARQLCTMAAHRRRCPRCRGDLRATGASARERGDRGGAHQARDWAESWYSSTGGGIRAAATRRSSGSWVLERSSGLLNFVRRRVETLWSSTRGQGGLWFTGGGKSSNGQNSPEKKSGRDSGEARA